MLEISYLANKQSLIFNCSCNYLLKEERIVSEYLLLISPSITTTNQRTKQYQWLMKFLPISIVSKQIFIPHQLLLMCLVQATQKLSKLNQVPKWFKQTRQETMVSISRGIWQSISKLLIWRLPNYYIKSLIFIRMKQLA